MKQWQTDITSNIAQLLKGKFETSQTETNSHTKLRAQVEAH